MPTRDEQIRIASLKAAVVRSAAGWSAQDVLKLADLFGEYIRTGQVPPEQRRW